MYEHDKILSVNYHLCSPKNVCLKVFLALTKAAYRYDAFFISNVCVCCTYVQSKIAELSVSNRQWSTYIEALCWSH